MKRFRDFREIRSCSFNIGLRGSYGFIFCVLLCFLLFKENSCCQCYLLFLNDCAAAEVEFRRERYAVHFLFCIVVEGDFFFGYDSAGEKLAVDVYPCVLRHQELMQIPCEPCFVEGVGLKVPGLLIILLAHCLTRE